MKKVIGIAAAIVFFSGCATKQPYDAGYSFEAIASGKATNNIIYKYEDVRDLDIYTPILKGRENGSAKVSQIQPSYTGSLNGPLLTLALKNIINDNLVFTAGLMNAGPGNCPSCRYLTNDINDSRFSIFAPSVGYGKSFKVDKNQSFGEQAKPILDEIAVAMAKTGCKPVKGQERYKYLSPISDSKNFLVGRYACPLPEELQKTASLSNSGRGQLPGRVLAESSGTLDAPNLTRTFIIIRDEQDKNILHTSAYSNCSLHVYFARGRNTDDIHRNEWDLCKSDTLPLSKNDGWAVITTFFSPELDYKSVLDIKSSEWSGFIESPFQSPKIASVFYK